MIRMSFVTGLFFLVLLLNHQWSPLLRLQASHCSTFRIMCDVPSIAVFCSESIVTRWPFPFTSRIIGLFVVFSCPPFRHNSRYSLASLFPVYVSRPPRIHLTTLNHTRTLTGLCSPVALAHCSHSHTTPLLVLSFFLYIVLSHFIARAFWRQDVTTFAGSHAARSNSVMLHYRMFSWYSFQIFP